MMQGQAEGCLSGKTDAMQHHNLSPVECRALQLLTCCREPMGGEFRVESWANLQPCCSCCASLMAACATCMRAVCRIASLPDSHQHTPQSCPSLLSACRRAPPAWWGSAAKFTAHSTPQCGGFGKGMNRQCCERQFHKPQLDFLGQKMSCLN